MPRWLWVVNTMLRRLWLRATLLGLLGVAAAILAAFVQRFVPWQLPSNIGASSVGTILNIMASSMLTVTTFSLSVVTSAYGAATSNVSPRATKLVMEDSVTQNALSVFMGSFLFSIVGIIVLQTGAYGDRGRAILFIVTIGVVVLIVVSLLRWIDHLTGLGRVGETTSRVEAAAREALQGRLDNPYLGGHCFADPERELPQGAVAIHAEDIGYLLHIDMVALSRAAETLGADLYLAANPGGFVYADTILAWVTAHEPSEAAKTCLSNIVQAFSIGDERNFDQDPRFGLVVLSEIASRALSPAVNDPGTAIDVIGRLVRLLTLWSSPAENKPEAEIKHPRLHVPPLATVDLFEDGFMAIGRDGAGMIEVQLRLQKGLQALARVGDADFRAAAHAQAAQAAARAAGALTLPAEVDRLRRIGLDGAVIPPARLVP